MVRKTHIGEGARAQEWPWHTSVTGLIKSLGRFPEESFLKSNLESDKRESSVTGCHLQPPNTSMAVSSHGPWPGID